MSLGVLLAFECKNPEFRKDRLESSFETPLVEMVRYVPTKDIHVCGCQRSKKEMVLFI